MQGFSVIFMIMLIPFMGAVAAQSFVVNVKDTYQPNHINKSAIETVELANSYLYGDGTLKSERRYLKLLLGDDTFFISPIYSYCNYDNFLVGIVNQASKYNLNVTLSPGGKNPKEINLASLTKEEFESNVAKFCEPSSTGNYQYTGLKTEYHFVFTK